MHLVVLVEDFYPNTSGGGLVRWEFCKRAAERGHEVSVLTPRREDLPKRETVEGVDIYRPYRIRPAGAPPYTALGIVGRVLFSVLLLGYSFRWARGRAVDGVHSSGYALHWVGKLLSLVYGPPFVPFVSYTPSTEGEWRPTPKFLLERLNFRLFMGDAVVCRDPAVRDILAEYVHGPVVLLHGILQESTVRAAASRADPAAVRDRFGIAEDEQFLVFVGRLVPIKNAPAALQVVAALPEQYRLVLVGDGPQRDEVTKAVADRGLEERVVLAGELPHEEALEVLVAADGLLLTSRAESYSAAALEGLALGCHVFATPVGVLAEIDHPRLHVGAIGELAERIRSTSFSNHRQLDVETLETYSLDRYTTDILETFERVSGDSGWDA